MVLCRLWDIKQFSYFVSSPLFNIGIGDDKLITV